MTGQISPLCGQTLHPGVYVNTYYFVCVSAWVCVHAWMSWDRQNISKCKDLNKLDNMVASALVVLVQLNFLTGLK